MPVNVIGTLKPKNNGKFPVAEAADIKVTDDLRLDEALENKADLSSVNFALDNKADKATTTSLQNQINNIIEPVTEEAEVINAREGADGTSYTTLKERCDSEYNAQTSRYNKLSDFNKKVAKDFGYYTDIELSYTSNKVPTINGTFYEDTGSTQHWFGSGYVELEADVKNIKYCGINFGTSDTKITPLAFYDSNKDFISCVPVTASFGPVEGNIDVPNGAKYFVQSKFWHALNPDRSSNNYTQYNYITTYDLEKIQENIEHNTEDINSIKTAVYGGAGKPVGEGTNNISNTEYIWFQYADPVHVTQIKFKAKAGTINFYKVNYVEGSGSLTYELIESVVNTSEEEGSIKTIDVDVPLSNNEYIGVNGAFFYTTSSSSEYYSRNFNISAGTVGPKQVQYLDFIAVYADSLAEQLNDMENDIESLNTRLIPLEIDKNIRKQGEVVLYNHNFTDTDEEFEGNQTFDSYGIAITSRVYLTRAYAVSDRTAKFVCKFNSDSIAHFEVLATDGETVNTRVIINIPNKTITLSGKAAVSCPFLNSSDEFIVSITKNYQDLRINVTDIYTGDEFNKEYIMSGAGGTGAGAIEVDKANTVPMQHSYYSLSSGSNSFSVSKMVIVSSKCDVLIYGDSITEGEAYWPHNLFDKHWVQMLVKKMSGKALASGRSGGSYSDIYARMQNEIPYIKPKYVMITTGTNGGATVQNYTTLVQYVKSQGCIPILNHIPCYDNNGDTSGFLTANANIDTVRAEEEVIGADFDLATSTAHNGQAIDTSTMWYEDYGNKHYYHHPNIKGCAAMFQRILIDIPDIFNV